MHGIVALLDDEHTAKVKTLWDELSQSCGLTCIQLTPFPHFSWHIAEDYGFKELEDKITYIVQQISPFTVLTTGLGVFTGKDPVVYIQIVKDDQLLNLHQYIWEETHTFGSGISDHYSPGQWMPHITLANRDVSDDNLPCIFSLLSKRSFAWEITINCFAIGYQHDDAPGEITKTFPLNSHK